MADEELSVVIRSSGGDNLIATFKAMSSGAQQMAVATEQANDRVGRSSKDAAKSTDDLRTRMAALGGAATTAAGFLADWSRSSQDADAIQRQLEASIEATGQSYETYAARVEAAGAAAVRLGQDDEAASQAISVLTQVTGSASVALDQMGLVMDLAAARHMSLEAAATLVGKVLEGNVGILNRQGFAIDENATAQEALAEVQKAVAGQAEANATTYGRMREEFSNLTDSIGGTVGEFAPLLAMLPGASVAFSAVGTAVGALAPTLTKAAVGGAALTAAMGPIGLALAAGAAAIAIFKFVDATDGSEASVAAATKKVEDFQTALASLASQSNSLSLLGSTWSAEVDALFSKFRLELGVGYQGTFEEIQARYKAELLANLTAILTATGPGAEQARKDTQALLDTWGAASEITPNMLNAITAISGYLDVYDQNAIVAIENTKALALAQTGAADSFKVLGEVVAGLGTKYEDTAEGQQLLADLALIQAEGTDAMKASIQALFPAFEAGTDVTGRFTTAVIWNAAMLRDQAAAATEAANATASDFARSADRQAASQERQSANIIAVQDRAFAAMKRQEAAAYSMAAAQKTFTGVTQEQTAAQAAAESKMIALEGAAYSMAGAQQAASVAVADHNEELQKATDAAIAFIGAEENIIDVMLRARSLRGNQNNLENVDKLLDSQAGIEAVFGTIVSGTEALGKSTDQIDQWASDLVEVVDGQSQLGDLLARGVITQNQYNRALEAQGRISATNAAIQDDLLSIQVRQAPFIEEQTRAYADQIDALADLSVKQQRIELGFIDQGERAKVASSYATAYSASLGEIPKDVATKIIVSDVESDPILKEVLKEYDLIEEGADGTITVNFDDGPTLTGAVSDLTGAVVDLTAAIVALPTIEVEETGAEETEFKILAVYDAQGKIIPEVGTTITAEDNATSVLDGVLARMNEVSNSSATARITTIYETIGSPGGGQAVGPGGGDNMLGGVIGYANGGRITARLSEAGYELVNFQNGGVGLAPQDGYYNLMRGDFVTPHPESQAKLAQMGGGGFVFNNYGPINGINGIEEVVSSFESALRSHLVGLGVL